MKTKYIWLEPRAYPADYEWLSMTPQERGCYHSLVIFLACNDGRLPHDAAKLQNLCNETPEKFENFWKKYKHKFQVSNGNIRHKRVCKELTKARKYIKQKSLAGKASANARFNSRSTAVQRPNQRKESKVKVSKVKEKEVYIYTRNDVLAKAIVTGLSDEEATIFYDHYNGQGWLKGNGLPITNLASTMQSWKRNQHKFADKAGSGEIGKTRLLPIVGKTCSEEKCRQPAVYKDTSGAYDRYCCSKHLPKALAGKFY